MPKDKSTILDEREKRRLEWREKHDAELARRQQERAEQRQKQKDENYPSRNYIGMGKVYDIGKAPTESDVKPETSAPVEVVDDGEPAKPKTLSQQRKEWLSRLYQAMIQDSELPTRERLSAAALLQKLEGWERQEVKVEVSAVSAYFQNVLPQIANQTPAWLPPPDAGK